MHHIARQAKSILGLSFQIAKAEFKLKNEGSRLGYLWYILDPLATFLIFILIRFAVKIGDSPDYGIYLILGIVIFNFFKKTSISSTRSILRNDSFIKTRKVRKEVFVLSDVMSGIIAHMFEILILLVFFVIYQIPIYKILFYIALFLPYLLFTIGTSFILATISVFIVDINNIWNIFCRLLWFATPVFYNLKPGQLIYTLNMYNPLYHIITMTRNFMLYDKLPSILSITGIVALSILIFFLGLFVFNKYKNKFVELI